MERILKAFLSNLIRQGSLAVHTASGSKFTVGDGTGECVTVRIANRKAQSRLIADAELATGELFMEGDLLLEGGSIYDLLALAMRNLTEEHEVPWMRLLRQARVALRRFYQNNNPLRARRNVAHHYDLDGRLYALFLDSDRQYSCAYFERPGQDLEDAQLAKKRHIAVKLLIEPRHTILDIGCGWGGMALYLADFCNARVTGITLSNEQLATANGRAAERKLGDRATFRLQDYRDVAERFDRIVSIGMFEHVGVGYYDAFFRKTADLLNDDGIMLLHSIGRKEGPGATNPWVQKYIFPGGYIPALSEVLAAIERAGFFVTDIEILRLHYAETLRAWRQRFLARREEAKALYGERFCRMWEFYLAGAECTFRFDGHVVFQIQLSKKLGTVPLTRDYIEAQENTLRARDRDRRGLRLAGE